MAVWTRHAEDAVVLGDVGEKDSSDVGNERLARQVEQGLARVQRLKQRAGVVPEDVGHFARGKAGLDDVVTLCTLGRDFGGSILMPGFWAMNASASAWARSVVTSVLSTR